jgi:hypothetical protein
VLGEASRSPAGVREASPVPLIVPEPPYPG